MDLTKEGKICYIYGMKILGKLSLIFFVLTLLGCTTLQYQSQYQSLDNLRASGQITEDEYRWRYSMLKNEELATRSRKLQMFGLIQNRQYQQQSLSNQREAINTQKQPTYNSGTIYDNKTGKTYTYQGVERKE